MNITHVATFHRAIKAASSMPLIVSGEDDNTYVIKLKGGGDGVLANIVEWIAFSLAKEIKIPVVEHVLLEIDEQLCKQVGDPEIREPLEKSIGINFGSIFIEDAQPYTEQKIKDAVKQQIFLFDVLLVNIDRTVKNSNIIIADSQAKCLDFSSSLMLRYCIEDSFFDVETVLKEMRKHPFYSDANPEQFIYEIRSIPDTRLESIIMSIPDVWIAEHFDAAYSKAVKNAIYQRLKRITHNAGSLQKTLTMLKAIQMQTEEEWKNQVEANRKSFEEKFGKM